MKNIKLVSILAFGFLLASVGSLVPAAESPKQQQVYGWELMTPQEREAHRTKMRSLQTDQEREAYRREHHKPMQERAKEKGVTLPDTPQQRGSGKGYGSGQGAGGGKRGY